MSIRQTGDQSAVNLYFKQECSNDQLVWVTKTQSNNQYEDILNPQSFSEVFSLRTNSWRKSQQMKDEGNIGLTSGRSLLAEPLLLVINLLSIYCDLLKMMMVAKALKSPVNTDPSHCLLLCFVL